VNDLYPEELSAAVLGRIKSDQPVSGVAYRYIQTALPKDQEELISTLVDGAAPDRREYPAIGLALDDQSIEKLIREMLALRQRAETATTQAEEQAFNKRFDAIGEVLAQT